VTPGNRILSAITPTTVSSFSFNEQQYQQQITPNNIPDSPTDSIKSVEEDIIGNPLFCDTKDGDLCFCETVENLTKGPSQLPSDNNNSLTSVGRYYFDQKAGKRMWIIPKETVAVAQCTTPTTPSQSLFSNFTACNDISQTSHECPTLPSSEQSDSQWQLPEEEEQCYFSPSPSPVATTQHHPLNLKWILGDNNSDESGDV